MIAVLAIWAFRYEGAAGIVGEYAWVGFLMHALGLGMVIAGAFANSGAYRGLEVSPKRVWMEMGGSVAIILGILLFGNGITLYLLSAEPAPFSDIMTIGVALGCVGLIGVHRHIIRICTSPSFPMTMIVVAAGVLGLVALALVSIINLRHYRRIDLTDRGMYTLDQQTVNILKGMKKPLRIIGAMVQNPNPRSGIEQFNNVIRSRAGEMLGEYGNQSRLVEYTPLDFYADPEARAKLEDQYKIDILRDSVVFVYEGEDKKHKTKVVAFNELVSRPPMPNIPPQFKGEEVFTSALQSLVEGKTSKVYFVVGHGEKDIDEFDRDGLSDLAEGVRNDNCDVKTCELPEVPDDCDVLVIAGPKKPLLPQEIEAVRKHITEKGGSLVVMLDPAVGDTAKSGLEGLLAEQGIEVHSDQTIVDVSRLEILPGVFGAGPSVTVSTTDYPKGRAGMWPAPHPITRDMKKVRTAYYMACPVSSAMRPGPRGPQGDPYNVDLVKTSSRARAKADFDPSAMERMDIDRGSDKPGPFSIAVARGKWMEQEPPMPMQRSMPPRGRLVVFGDSDFVTNMFLKQGSTGNLALFRNCIAWIAGKEYKIGIPPKPLQQDRRLDLTNEEKSFARWATVVVPPFHILLIGVVVWWIRRR